MDGALLAERDDIVARMEAHRAELVVMIAEGRRDISRGERRRAQRLRAESEALGERRDGESVK